MKCYVCGAIFEEEPGNVYLTPKGQPDKHACAECSVKMLNKLDGLGDALASIARGGREAKE